MRGSRRSLGSLSCAVLVAAGASWSCRAVPEPPAALATDVVATYRDGEIRRADLAAWYEARPLLRGEVSEEKWGLDGLETLAVLRHLAAEAEAAGRHRGAQVTFEIRSREDRVLVGALRAEVVAAVPISETEIATTLAENEAERHKPERRRLRYLLKEIPEGAGPEARAAVRAEIEALRSRALAGEDFEALARAASDSPSRFRGGLLGVAERGLLPAVLDAAAFALPAGGFSPVLEAERSYVVIQCLEILPARIMPEEESRERIEAFLRNRRAAAAWADLEAALVAGRVEHDLAPLTAADTPPDAVVSRIGAETLTRAGVNLVLAESLGGAETRAVPVARVVEALDRYATRRLLAVEARRRGLGERPSVRGRLEVERQLLLARLELRERVDAASRAPTEEEVARRLAAQPEEFRGEEAFRVGVLWRPRREGREREDFELLTAAAAGVRAGEEDFAAAARRVSEHASGALGGDLGWRTRPELAAWGPIVTRTVLSLEVGATSGVVETERGFWVLRLVERRDAVPLTGEEAADAAREAIERESREEARETLLREILASLRLERAVPPAGGAAEPHDGQQTREGSP